MSKKHIFVCQGKKEDGNTCGKVLLKTHPKAHFHADRAKILTMVDNDDETPVVLPNVYCKHCKFKNLVQWGKPGLEETGKDLQEKLETGVFEEPEVEAEESEESPFEDF